MESGGGTVTRRRRGGRAARAAALALALALVVAVDGCGSSSGSSSASSKHPGSSTSTSSTQASPAGPGPSQAAHLATIGVVSSARPKGGGVILPRYTCHGANISPQINWKGLPGVLAGAKEVVIFVRTLVRDHPITNWAVAGIEPSVTNIEAGQLPKGAVVGRNSFGKVGYSVCPPSGPGGSLVTIGVYALPQVVPLKSGFDPESLKHELAGPEVQWGSLLMLTKRQPAARG